MYFYHITLKREYPLFLTDSNSLPPQGPQEVVPDINTMQRVNAETPAVSYTVMCATDAHVASQEIAALTNAAATSTGHPLEESTNAKSLVIA